MNGLQGDRMETIAGPVLLYDGECGLCHVVVRLLLRLDCSGRLRFTKLQGAFAQATLRRLGLPTENFDSIVYLPEAGGAEYRLRTDGVIGVLRLLGGFWSGVGAAFAVVPSGWRDAAYLGVAKVRYRIFGKRDPARPVDTRHADRFID
jgi:predicted DCC family thiol-disulfide oxidoreductase YuxK